MLGPVQIFRQGIKLVLPESLIEANPLAGVLEWSGRKPAAVHAPVFFARQQMRPLQHAQMLGHGGQRHLERLRQLRHRGFPARQTGEDGAARGVGQGAKRDVEPRGLIVNHMV